MDPGGFGPYAPGSARYKRSFHLFSSPLNFAGTFSLEIMSKYSISRLGGSSRRMKKSKTGGNPGPALAICTDLLVYAYNFVGAAPYDNASECLSNKPDRHQRPAVNQNGRRIKRNGLSIDICRSVVNRKLY